MDVDTVFNNLDKLKFLIKLDVTVFINVFASIDFIGRYMNFTFLSVEYFSLSFILFDNSVVQTNIEMKSFSQNLPQMFPNLICLSLVLPLSWVKTNILNIYSISKNLKTLQRLEVCLYEESSTQNQNLEPILEEFKNNSQVFLCLKRINRSNSEYECSICRNHIITCCSKTNNISTLGKKDIQLKRDINVYPF